MGERLPYFSRIDRFSRFTFVLGEPGYTRGIRQAVLGPREASNVLPDAVHAR
ncbi:MAG TPA: hypothetical protein VK587_04600 [bacterium]|nr:hypothetical protein [bacterium]